MSSQVLVSVQSISKKYCRDQKASLRYAMSDALRSLVYRRALRQDLRDGEFWALKDISFDLHRGESLGVMGVNGAGKSTLLRLILGSLRLTQGQVETRGRIGALSEMGLGFNQVLSGRENAFMSAAVLGIDRRRIEESFDEIVAFAELEDFIDAPVQIYSTGMRARLGFAVAMFLEPDVLLVDEVLAVGDIGFQRRCIARAKQYLERGGSLILVSHNPHLVQSLCSRCLVLDHGMTAFDGDCIEGVARYFHLVDADPNETVDAILEDRKPDPEPEVPIPEREPDAAVVAPEPAPPLPVPELPPLSDVRIEALGIEPLQGELRTGLPARVFLRYSAREVHHGWWGFKITTSDLQTTITADGQLAVFDLPSGRHELACVIARLPLVSGRFALQGAIMDSNTGMPLALRGFHDSAPSFEVKRDPRDLRENFRRYNTELIVMEGVTREGPTPLADAEERGRAAS